MAETTDLRQQKIAERHFQVMATGASEERLSILISIFQPVHIANEGWLCQVDISGAVELQQAYGGTDSLQALEQALCSSALMLLMYAKGARSKSAFSPQGAILRAQQFSPSAPGTMIGAMLAMCFSEWPADPLGPNSSGAGQ